MPPLVNSQKTFSTPNGTFRTRWRHRFAYRIGVPVAYHDHMSSGETCIYCGSCFDPNRGEGDHIIPAQLGEFRNDTRFRRVCPGCNSRIGQAEQQMVQSGPEGFFRRIVKPKSKRLGKRGIGRPRGAMGAPPPEHMIDMGDHHALVEPSDDNPQNVSPVDHIFVRDKDGKEARVRLYPSMRADQIRSALAGAGVSEMKEARLHCGDENWAKYTGLLQEVWPKSKLEEGEPTPAGVHPAVPGAVKFVVNTAYFRSLAKMAFHYYLAHSSRGHRGDGSCFRDIRDFILNGGDSDRFFKERHHPQFVLPFGELISGGVVTPSQWCHVLAASELNGFAVAYVQLFVGPGCIPAPHYVSLGRWHSPVISPKGIWGHIYLYDNPQQAGRYAGRVVAAQITGFRPR